MTWELALPSNLSRLLTALHVGITRPLFNDGSETERPRVYACLFVYVSWDIAIQVVHVNFIDICNERIRANTMEIIRWEKYIFLLKTSVFFFSPDTHRSIGYIEERTRRLKK